MKTNVQTELKRTAAEARRRGMELVNLANGLDEIGTRLGKLIGKYMPEKRAYHRKAKRVLKRAQRNEQTITSTRTLGKTRHHATPGYWFEKINWALKQVSKGPFRLEDVFRKLQDHYGSDTVPNSKLMSFKASFGRALHRAGYGPVHRGPTTSDIRWVKK